MLRKWLKQLGKQAWTRRFLGWVMHRYIQLAMLTGRWTYENKDPLTALEAEGKPIVLAFWHGRLLMMPYSWLGYKTPFYMLISAHRDGEIPAVAIEKVGIHTIRGSSKRGGAGALRALVKTLKSGNAIGFTPDGPQGPRMRVKGGVVAAAQMAGAYIVPVSFAASRQWHAKSWDRFTVPLLFSRGLFRYGDPIEVPRKMDETAFEAKRLEVEEAMIGLSQSLDREMGNPPVDPAPAEDMAKFDA